MEEIKKQNETPGEIGLILSCVGLILFALILVLGMLDYRVWGKFIIYAYFTSIGLTLISLVLVIIQRRITKTKVSLAGLIISILAILSLTILTVWAAIIPLISTPGASYHPCLEASSEILLEKEGTFIGESGELHLKVKRGPRDFELVGLYVFTSINGDSTRKNINHTLPAINGEKEYVLNDLNYSGYDIVEVAPLVGAGNVIETCDITSRVELKGSVWNSSIPNN